MAATSSEISVHDFIGDFYCRLVYHFGFDRIRCSPEHFARVVMKAAFDHEATFVDQALVWGQVKKMANNRDNDCHRAFQGTKYDDPYCDLNQ